MKTTSDRATRPEIYAHPWLQLVRLTERGLLHQVADGYYVVVPQDMAGRAWKPPLGDCRRHRKPRSTDQAMSSSWGRAQHDCAWRNPRALATATIAVPSQHRAIELSDSQPSFDS